VSRTRQGIEDHFQQMREATPSVTLRQLLTGHDAQDALAHHYRRRAHAENVRALESRRALAEAARVACDDDLESAWASALRGEFDQARSRLAGYVRPKSRVKAHKGTPWRLTGWLDAGRR